MKNLELNINWKIYFPRSPFENLQAFRWFRRCFSNASTTRYLHCVNITSTISMQQKRLIDDHSEVSGGGDFVYRSGKGTKSPSSSHPDFFTDESVDKRNQWVPERFTESEFNDTISALVGAETETVVKKRWRIADATTKVLSTNERSRLTDSTKAASGSTMSRQEHPWLIFSLKEGEKYNFYLNKFWEVRVCQSFGEDTDVGDTHLPNPGHFAMFGKRLTGINFKCLLFDPTRKFPNDFNVYLYSKGHNCNIKFYNGRR